MFGYIRPLEAELRVRELECYKAVYCGVCRNLSGKFGPPARFALSYDATFAALLYASVHDESPTIVPRRCPYSPAKKRPHYEPCEALDFCCDAAMLLLVSKVEDNCTDSRSPFWRLALPIVRLSTKKAALRRPEIDAATRRIAVFQREIEAQETVSLDSACDPSASALSEFFMLMSEEAGEQRVLQRLGYMLGRFVYLCDAIEDYESDIAHRRFNPLPAQHDEKWLREVMRATIFEVCSAYELLSPRYFKPILDNILHLGLEHTAERLITGRKYNGRPV